VNDAGKLVDDEPSDRAREREFFGLRIDESTRQGTYVVADALSNPRGSFYGGAGTATTVLMMEAATGRRVVWTTLQFLAAAARGDELECIVEVLSRGGRSSQVRVTTSHGGEPVCIALGTTGDPRIPLSTTVERMPLVPSPEDCPVVEHELPGDVSRSRFAWVEHRLAADHDEPGLAPTQLAYWVRVAGMTATPALLGYVADAVALGMFPALGLPIGQATSLDNTLRVGPSVATEWMLLDLRAHMVADGYAHGGVNLWAPDGTLLGVASQTLVLRPI
jgi:acyl-CoA thioesterase